MGIADLVEVERAPIDGHVVAHQFDDLSDAHLQALSDGDLGLAVTNLHAEALSAANRTAAVAMAIGRALDIAKGRMEHGAFLTWLREKANMTPRTGQRYMAFARSYLANPNTTTVAHLTMAEAKRQWTRGPKTQRSAVETLSAAAARRRVAEELLDQLDRYLRLAQVKLVPMLAEVEALHGRGGLPRRNNAAWQIRELRDVLSMTLRKLGREGGAA